MDRPHIRVIPEWFGGGTLPRKELHEAAEQLTASQAGLIAVGEPTIEQGLDKALTKAAKVVKRTVEATTDESPASYRKRSRADNATAAGGGFDAVLSAGPSQAGICRPRPGAAGVSFPRDQGRSRTRR